MGNDIESGENAKIPETKSDENHEETRFNFNKNSEALRNKHKNANRSAAMLLACKIIVISIVCSISVGMLVVLILGAHCIRTDDYDNCGSRDGAIAMVVLGVIYICGLCPGVIISKKLKS
jgi:hypothetical protein